MARNGNNGQNGKNGLNGKGRQIESLPTRRRGFLGMIWLPLALLLALSAGGMTGVLASYYFNNSQFTTEVSALATYRPPEVTKVYADDGETVIAEFFLQKRIPIKEKDIPQKVEEALIAVEDIRFYNHMGVDPYRMAGSLLINLTSGKMQGASTLTQQLARNLFLSNEQTYTRKFKEWMLSLQIERFYTKRQILEMYMNHVFLGANSYGFEAGAQTYFGKTLKDLRLEEAALLAAIPKSPTDYSPIRNMEKAKDRRDIVLDQMAKYGFISEGEASAAKAKPIELADTAYYQSQPKSSVADYPVEEIRKYLEEKYSTRVAQGGLKVYSTINLEGQKYAAKAVRERLRGYDRSRGWRSEYVNILLDENGAEITDGKAIQKRLEAYKHPDWYGDEYEEGEYKKGLVTKVDAEKNEAEVRFGGYKAIVTSKNMGRSGKSPGAELKPGYLGEFEINKVDDGTETLEVTLSQVPDVQAAIVCLNAKTGEIVAMIGGYDYQTNKFNNATQGLRQTGSAYKPFIYAAAVEWGITPEMLVSGAPMRRGGWQPHNYDGSLSHPNVPMKVALAKSYNLAAVHLMDQVGVQVVSQTVRRFGVTYPMAPVLPSALGASEVPLIEMVSAYSVFPNKGVRVQPHLVRKVLNRDGSILEEWEKTTYKVTSEYTASTVADMMRGVVRGGGTATNASAGGHQLAGKTGTVNDHTDVWFIGYTPTYVTGVWMGNPERKESLGKGMTGGAGAVPYFNAFMNPFMKDKPVDSFSKPPAMPADIKALSEQRKREELEKLEKAEVAGRGLDSGYRRSGGASSPGGAARGNSSSGNSSSGGGFTRIENLKDDDIQSTAPTRNSGDSTPANPGDKPGDGKPGETIIRRPPPDTIRRPDPPQPEPSGPKKKGKKGGDDKDNPNNR
jgi:penicillin-binding protein 1A